jgi:antagonist of KipI
MSAPGAAMATGPCLEVLEPGLLATIQDAGRPALGGLGITPGGAADRHSLAVANALLGNAPGDAALELTLAGSRLGALRPVTVAVAGADLGAVVEPTGEIVAPGRTIALRAGDVLAFARAPGGASPAAAPGTTGVPGCRAVVAVPGGIDVPVVLGARATALGAGFGGLEGRPLRAGDRLTARDPGLERPPARWTGPVTDPAAGPVRVLPGPAATGPTGADLATLLAAHAWTVAPASDRIGLRLAGPPLPASPAALASHGVLAGTVQLPPDGLPIILLADHQPTGGYPVVGVVASVDRPRLGQLAPGMSVAFELVDEAAARRLAATHRAAVARALAQLREAETWDALWRGAGG